MVVAVLVLELVALVGTVLLHLVLLVLVTVLVAVEHPSLEQVEQDALELST